MKRPDCVKDEHLEYLDSLRESGVTNMFAAPTYVHNAFDVSREDAREIVMYWMKTFGQEKR